VFLLAHLSDLHATRVGFPRPGELTAKRALGWLSWTVRRRKEHRRVVLEALLRDLAEVAPDHVAVTGDVTNLGLEAELLEAADWLRRLGEPERVSVVPGNHDVYAADAPASAWRGWEPYLGASPVPGSSAGPSEFPSVRRRGAVALVGVSSAIATPTHLATGRVGADQLERLASALLELGAEGLCRIVLIHHPPVSAGLAARRQLSDAGALREVLASAGAELVLHGHTHRSSVDSLPGPSGAIPVLGVPSASAVGRRHADRRARYHLYRLEPQVNGAAGPLRVSRAVRGFDPATGRFAPEGDQPIAFA
jgi:3',5'-cyclic AMP phosphodiesterase CpdA